MGIAARGRVGDGILVVLAGRAAVEGKEPATAHGERFDDLVKRLAAARLTRLAALRGVVGAAGVALASSGDADVADAQQHKRKKLGKGKTGAKGKDKPKDKGRAADKITLCHCPPGNPDNCHTIRVGPKAADKHLQNFPGDHLGSCDGTTTTAEPTTTTTTTAEPTTTTTAAPTTTTTPLACQANNSACTQAGQCCSGNCFNFVCADFVTSCGGSTCGPDTRGCAGDTCCGPPAFYSCVAADIAECCGPPATHCEGGSCVA